jgi:hypothetical protein
LQLPLCNTKTVFGNAYFLWQDRKITDAPEATKPRAIPYTGVLDILIMFESVSDTDKEPPPQSIIMRIGFLCSTGISLSSLFQRVIY